MFATSDDAAPPAPKPAPATQPVTPDQASQRAQEYAQRISAANAPAAAEPASVRWLEPKPLIEPPSNAEAPPTTRPAPIAAQLVTPQRVVAATQPTSRQELTRQLLAQLRSGGDPAMSKALSAATLSLLLEQKQLDTEDLAGLDATGRETVQRYQQLLLLLDEQLRAGKPLTDREAIDRLLDGLVTSPPLTIRALKLCKRVTSYGVYEEFADTSILAGREFSAVLYVELDHFKLTKLDSGKHQARVSQEVELLSDADGLVVWKQPKVQIVDESVNRRRDFFLVQMIRLPARLTVGKYRLRARVTDEATGSVGEQSIPLKVVADTRLITQPVAPPGK
jgi:hypothetical protein